MGGRLARLALGAMLIGLLTAWVIGQESQRRWRRGRGRQNEQANSRYFSRNGVPEWETNQAFKKDVFTFARIRYRRAGRWGWDTDYPDADLNLSYRLQEMTSLEVDPNGVVLWLTDPALMDYPFIYIVEPGSLSLDEAEVAALRHYLDRGGFLMVDDFWGEDEWNAFYRQIKRVFPEREPIELSLDHEIFHNVYELREKPIIPSIHTYYRGWRTERPDAREAHFRAILDDDERIMVMICHNTDFGDGWEREGVDPGYFEAYSEKYAYPLGINIITYAMTH